MGVRIEFDDVDDLLYVLTGERPEREMPEGLKALLQAVGDSIAKSAADKNDAMLDACSSGPGDTETNLVTDYASLRVGDAVRWEGRTIQADGEVVDVDVDDDITVVRIRRDDTGKTFKITFDDSPTYGKMYKL